MRMNGELTAGLVLVGSLLAMTAVGFAWTPHGVNEMDAQARSRPPSAEHWLGTDNFGRDVFSRVMYGGRTAFIVGSVAVGIGLSLGTIAGGIAGYFGGVLDELLMRVADGMLAFPGIVMALMVIAVAGPGTYTTALAIGVMTAPGISRIARSGFLQYRNREFVLAARMIGARPLTIVFGEILPNVLSPLLVAATIGFGTALLSEAGLSYLGLGIQPPDPSWGRMLRESQGQITRAPWLVLGPGAAITTLVLGFYLLGNGIRDLLDPKASKGVR